MALSKIQGIEGQVTPNLGRRNMLINGDFQVWQRGTSGTVNTYTCDRWFGWGYQQALTRQAADGTSQNDGRFGLRVQHNDGTANQFSSIAQTLETADTGKARGKKLTFSIDAKKGSAFTGNLTLQIVTRTDAQGSINTGTRQVLVTEDITSSLTTSMKRFTCTTTSTVSQDAKVVGVNVNHTGTTGTDANNYFQVERAQLEIGDTATDFEHPVFGQEIQLCKRYFQRISGFKQGAYSPCMIAYSTTAAQGTLHLQTTMFSTPSVSLEGAGLKLEDGGAGYPTSSTTFAGQVGSENHINFWIGGFSGLTDGNAYYCYGDDANHYIDLSAEVG